MNSDAEHLQLLSIFHYVVGGMAALFALFPVLHLVVGIAMVTGRMETHEDVDARLFGLFFIAVAAVMIAAGLTFAVCLIAAGRFLARRAHYMFCLVVAAFACAFIPFGTVLGVFTIIVLQRPSVKQMFAVSPPTGPPPTR